MSEDDSVENEGKWTRADLPPWGKIREADDMAGNGLRSRVIDIALNEVVEHLNAHHPRPEQSVCAESDNADEPMMPRETLRERAASDGRLWSQAYAEGVASAERTELERDRWKAATKRALEHRDEWKGRAEKAEADLEELSEEFSDFRAEVVAEAVKYQESHPPISRADIDGALINVTSNAMNYPDPLQMLGKDTGPLRKKCVDAMCDLLGIEAEQSVDLIEEKAIAAFKVAWHEADMHGDEGNRTRRGIRAARKVIEGDRK